VSCTILIPGCAVALQESELPVLSPSALTEVCSAFVAASLRGVEPKMARRLTEVASSLNAKDLSSAWMAGDDVVFECLDSLECWWVMVFF
jgi:hypothetical protein